MLVLAGCSSSKVRLRRRRASDKDEHRDFQQTSKRTCYANSETTLSSTEQTDPSPPAVYFTEVNQPPPSRSRFVQHITRYVLDALQRMILRYGCFSATDPTAHVRSGRRGWAGGRGPLRRGRSLTRSCGRV
eukprot:1188320-Prorocentrum_minimum.AAC.1